jgi:hypothetical protein
MIGTLARLQAFRSEYHAARPSRRGDRITMPFAAVHESPVGTNRTSSDVRSSVAIGRKADMAFAQADF